MTHRGPFQPLLFCDSVRCAIALFLWPRGRHGSAAAISQHLSLPEVETWGKMPLGRTGTGAGRSPTWVPLLQNATSLLG